MNRGYQRFGQGLTQRGNTRPSIATAGGWRVADYNPADLHQRHFIIPKHLNHPIVQTKIGESTEQKAYKNWFIEGGNRASYNAGMTGTGGFYRRKHKRRTGGNYSNIRNIINKVSTGGCYKKKRKQHKSKRSKRR